MTRRESAIIGRLWADWATGKPLTNQLCTDFYFEVVLEDRRVRDVNVFEVLDLIVNTDLRESA